MENLCDMEKNYYAFSRKKSLSFDFSINRRIKTKNVRLKCSEPVMYLIVSSNVCGDSNSDLENHCDYVCHATSCVSVNGSAGEIVICGAEM